ncbi:SNF1-related protein kinase regulatory subunit beta-2 [Perilla frutescens var. hirtella]|uniref:SNF1-related protein kinase regulatory subunit beta-2 n=1 Tax=Perilla frutescens var. hirtella TaxID=608512 RepID=A0AAD4JPL4_PERFH|nr:SNF1-related protein kinase regulatory subunit beta-2 [Perilla frutescens var. frutescens]KAH6787786.1 SNF1-related protein kinase regulatory subunit beta-2 [Perilla frutescens var. hirtella]KAH6837706.1 SNF1-related protein kinase regulatory subunit beta-2 [Perilla frutescens var. hirtella]
MGNANGREEGSSDTQLGVEDSAAAQVSMADQDLPHGPEYMGGHSPPSSPRASQSPLMFRPQMPVVPLQRPDELNIPSPSWMQTSSGYEDVYNEQGIPTMITWSYGGKEVSVEGSWDSCQSRKPLQRSGKDFTIMKVLPSGVYQYRFLVDGQWRHSPDLPWDQDDSGNAYNILDLQDYVPEDIDSISGFEPPQSPDSSYNSIQLSQEDYGKEPPMVPPHLNLTLLNAPSPQMEIPTPHSRPQHVVLNHLYMHRDRSRPSVVALGSTNRFLSKYVTVVLYKSIQR